MNNILIISLTPTYLSPKLTFIYWLFWSECLFFSFRQHYSHVLSLKHVDFTCIYQLSLARYYTMTVVTEPATLCTVQSVIIYSALQDMSPNELVCKLQAIFFNLTGLLSLCNTNCWYINCVKEINILMWHKIVI